MRNALKSLVLSAVPPVSRLQQNRNDLLKVAEQLQAEVTTLTEANKKLVSDFADASANLADRRTELAVERAGVAERSAEVERLRAELAAEREHLSSRSIAGPVPTVPPERRLALCGRIDIARHSGIELGPLSRPIVRPEEGDIRYIDHASTDDLRKKYEINDGHDVSEFVDISFVWSGGRLRDAIPDGEIFDYALASHVIEHVPDVVGWLNDILSVLKDDGIVSLAIPDKRYTFDRFRTPTSPAVFLDHWMRKPQSHTAQQIFDHFSQVVKVGNDEIIAIFDGLDPITQRHSTDKFAFDMVKHIAETGEYIDCHASVFTPRSFLEALKVLIPLGVIEAEVIDFYDTRYRSQEFVCVLQKSKRLDVSYIDDVLRRLSKLPVSAAP